MFKSQVPSDLLLISAVWNMSLLAKVSSPMRKKSQKQQQRLPSLSAERVRELAALDPNTFGNVLEKDLSMFKSPVLNKTSRQSSRATITDIDSFFFDDEGNGNGYMKMDLSHMSLAEGIELEDNTKIKVTVKVNEQIAAATGFVNKNHVEFSKQMLLKVYGAFKVNFQVFVDQGDVYTFVASCEKQMSTKRMKNMPFETMTTGAGTSDKYAKLTMRISMVPDEAICTVFPQDVTFSGTVNVQVAAKGTQPQWLAHEMKLCGPVLILSLDGKLRSMYVIEPEATVSTVQGLASNCWQITNGKSADPFYFSSNQASTRAEWLRHMNAAIPKARLAIV